MGVFRKREDRLPVYERPSSPAKERYSNDGYSSDDDYRPHRRDVSSSSSTSASGSNASATPMLSKRRQPRLPRVANMYPYRLPTKVTRYLCIALFGTLMLIILSLMRASQVENWKVENGQTENRPPPPPVWERFPFIERYYGGVRRLKSLENSKPEYPESDHQPNSQSQDSQEYSQPESQPWSKYKGRVDEPDVEECFLDAAGTIRVPQVHFYNGRPEGYPRHVSGSYDVLDLPEDICFERYGRFGPYGFGYSVNTGGLGTGENGDKEGAAAIWQSSPRVDYKSIDWADVQRRCYRSNAKRFKDMPAKVSTRRGFYIDDAVVKKTNAHKRDAPDDGPEKPRPSGQDKEHKTESDDGPEKPKPSGQDKEHKTESDDEVIRIPPVKKSRTAVVIRGYDEYFYREDDIAAIRAMISELSLASGGRYDIHLLVQIKDDARHPIWADEEAYQARIRDTIPEEFRGLVTLWTETQMLSLYQGIYDLYSRGPDLPVHGVYRGLSMAMQYFAYLHPEYDYFWQWELDVRYIGHYYDLFSKIERFAKAQPRKGLWERNSRFYFPEVHGSWDDFSQLSRVQTEMGAAGADNVWKDVPGVDKPEKASKPRKMVWGPLRPADDNDWFEPGNDPIPPAGGPEKDRFEWGVGEEADYISLSPMFDPEGTTWGLRDDITGYNRTEMPPRRANIITTSRMSRRLLLLMHKMTAYKKQFAFPEMWPATVALQHGLKAVYAPHPMFVDRKWPLDYMSQVYNGGRDGTSGGSRASMFGDREHNMHGISWFYRSGFAPNLYRRWLGLKVNNDGGEDFELTEDKTKSGGSVGEMPGGEGRMCLPPVLLHPVKEVEIPVEAPLEAPPQTEAKDDGGQYDILDPGA
ncbi:unnamed protein product [Clonostachys rosea f. rosea IK726]|uniref:Uncharacterized protein n=2 Tax=Bionectria ochroleuca TaxID=29856 RepID=A0A0B7JQ04_BIOOC|nr:unnamed protein product [Clonostachys rosea f. rosea IK726]